MKPVKTNEIRGLAAGVRTARLARRHSDAVKGAAAVASPGRAVPFAYRDATGTAPNLLDWREGPQGAPPIVTV